MHLKRKRFCSVLLASALAFALPFQSLAADKLTRVSSGVYRLFEDGDTISGVLHRGVDVSHWQGEVDWKTAHANDVDFVMLGTRYQNEVDPLFRKNADDADAAGVKIGVYIYSYATSVAMAEAEADFVINLIKDYPISYPVAFDAENAETLGSRPKEEITAIVNAFCKKISDAGYYPILYANDYWLANKLDMNALGKYPVWGAAYERKLKYENPVMWQGTESGIIPGIDGGVDIDLQYKDFSAHCPADTWRKIGGKWYWYSNYRMQKDKLIFDGSNSYWMEDDGTIYRGWKTLDGKPHYFDIGSGIMRIGWKKIDDKWYRFDTDGSMMTGWVRDGADWFYMNSEGIMLTGWQALDGKQYYLDKSGVRKDGWQMIDGNWYWLGTDGAVQTGVVDVGGVRYCLGNDGKMLHDTTVDWNGITWTIDSNGVMHDPAAEAASQAAAQGTGETGGNAGQTGTGETAADAAQAGSGVGETVGGAVQAAESSAAADSQTGTAATVTGAPAPAESMAAPAENTASGTVSAPGTSETAASSSGTSETAASAAASGAISSESSGGMTFVEALPAPVSGSDPGQGGSAETGPGVTGNGGAASETAASGISGAVVSGVVQPAGN